MIIYLRRQLLDASSNLPGTRIGTGHPLFLLGFAPGGVCLAACVATDAGVLLPHRFTLTLHTKGNTLLCCTLPSSHLAWPLASTVPCGARTFLILHPARRDHPIYLSHISYCTISYGLPGG